jgi:hypothetical protein
MISNAVVIPCDPVTPGRPVSEPLDRVQRGLVYMLQVMRSLNRRGRQFSHGITAAIESQWEGSGNTERGCRSLLRWRVAQLSGQGSHSLVLRP